MANGQMFRVLLRMQIRDGAERDFERTWLEIGDAITGHPASLGQWLLRSEDEPDVYYIVSDWTDERSFREFEHSPAHVTHRERLHPYRSGGSMSTMRLVRYMAGAASRPGGLAAGPGVQVAVWHRAADAAAIEDAYRLVSKRLAGTAGLLGNRLLRSLTDPASYLIQSEWQDLGAFTAWERTPGHPEATAPLRQYRDYSSQPGGHAVYEMTAGF